MGIHFLELICNLLLHFILNLMESFSDILNRVFGILKILTGGRNLYVTNLHFKNKILINKISENVILASKLQLSARQGISNVTHYKRRFATVVTTFVTSLPTPTIALNQSVEFIKFKRCVVNNRSYLEE